MESESSRVVGAFRAALDAFQTGLEMMRQNLRRRHPHVSNEEIERLLGEWLQDRPGAEVGDCPGRPVDVNARLA
jgi:hypothetical protein